MKSENLMKKLIVATIAGLTLLNACKVSESPKAANEPIILTIADLKVPQAEFEYVYKKNNANAPDAFTDASVREYLNLYTNFRLKVLEAQRLGYDTTQSFKNELETYRKQLAQPYLSEKKVTEELVKEAYERMKEEVSTSHILINVSPDAEPKDTLNAYNRAMEARGRVLKGELFEKVAREMSQDPSAQQNGGNIGYFKAMQLIYPYEDAIYSGKIGDITMPVRTRFGYHIIRIDNRRPSQGKVRVGHIMIRANEGMPSEDSIAAKKRIDEIFAQLKAGEKFETLCSRFSEDPNTKDKGGELQMFGTNEMIPSFEAAAFALKEPGDYSSPVLTPYGWHIIRLIEKKGLEPFKELESSLRGQVAKDSRSELSRASLIARLKKENGFTENGANLQVAMGMVDSTLFNGTFEYNASDKRLANGLFSIKANKYSIKDLFDYAKGRKRAQRDISAGHYLRLLYNQWVEESIIAFEEANLADKYIDYKMLYKEYRDGILLFSIMDEKIWSRGVQDSAGLQSFYDANKAKYRWEERADLVMYDGADEKTVVEARNLAKADKYPVPEISVPDITFEKGKYNLTLQDSARVRSYIRALNSNPALFLEITGYYSGDEKAGIGLQRAKEVASVFQLLGIDAKRLRVMEMAPPKPVKKGAKAEKIDPKVNIKTFSTAVKAIESTVNKDNPLRLKITEGKFQKNDLKALSRVEMKPGITSWIDNGRYYVVEIKSIEAPRDKTFEEARGLVISDYQNHLDKEWIKELRAKYPVSVKEEEVKKLIKN